MNAFPITILPPGNRPELASVVCMVNALPRVGDNLFVGPHDSFQVAGVCLIPNHKDENCRVKVWVKDS